MAKSTTKSVVRKTAVVEEPAEESVVVVQPRSLAEDIVWFVLTIILTLLSVRFVLLLFGASDSASFVRAWYRISAPLVAPFTGIFPNSDYTTYAGQRIEIESLVAMLMYGLIAYLIVLAIRLIQRNN